MISPVTYLKQVGQELRKVTWPTRQQTQTKTLVVLGVSFALAAYIGIIDFALQKLLAVII